MGCCFSFDETSEGKHFNYSRPKGTSTYTIDRTYNAPLIELNFDGWFESSVRLWQKNNKARPDISFSCESGIFDTVF